MADSLVEAVGSSQSPADRMGSAEKTLFSSHTVRELGLAAVFVFAIAGFGLTYSGSFLFTSAAGVFPGVNLFGVLTFAVLVGLVFAYLYAAMGALAPRFGADYVIASRVLPPYLAFASSFMLVLSFSLMGGALLSSIVQRTLPAFARTLSILTASEGMDPAVSWAATPSGVVTLGTLAVLLVFLLLILPPRVTYLVLLAGLGLSILAWLLIVFQVGSASGAFPAAWDRLIGAGSFQDVLAQAASAGMEPDAGLGRTLAAGLVLSLWLVSGYGNPARLAGEVKNPEKNLLRGSWLALLAAWMVLGVAALAVQSVVGREWLSAQSFLYQSGAPATPWVMLYAAVASRSTFLSGLAGIIWIFTILNMAHVMMYAASRELVAWSKDRIAPKAVAYMHPVLRSPLIAVLLVSVIAELGVVDAALNGVLFQRYNVLFFLAVVQILPVLALALLPYRRYEIYRTGPPFTRVKVGPVPLVTIAGGLAVAYLVGLVTANAVLRVFGGIGIPTMLVFGIFFGGGLAIYYTRRYLLRAEGRDWSEGQFDNLPEE